MDRYNLISLFGLFAMLVVAWSLSEHRKAVNWRLLAWGVGLQFVFGAFVFLVPAGKILFQRINDLVIWLLKPAGVGIEFVFGPLALGPDQKGSVGFILATQALPLIIFVSALMSLLYYCRIMPLVIEAFAYVFTRLMRVSGAEALCAASNIFVGVESATVIRPYLKKMTRSELCVVLTTGMATVASNVLGLYVVALGGRFPAIAGHLVSASVLSALAALMMAKLLVPEREEPRTLGVAVRVHYDRESSLFEAIINGAEVGMKLVLGIAALLIAVLGLVALVNAALGHFWTGGSLERLFGYACCPFTYAMGVPWEDVPRVAAIIGERVIKTEVASYFDLAAAADSLQPRSVIIATYALCGFAHFASVAIFVGGTAAIVPERKKDLAQVAWRALLAATLACFMTACIAGVFTFGDQASAVLQGLR